VDWLVGRKSAVLADDMGLGKTIQAILAFDRMLGDDEVRNALVVCPKSVIGVWESEIKLWAPHLCVVAAHRGITPEEWRAVGEQCHVCITNYEGLRLSPPSKGAFDLVIFDEVHKLKNRTSATHEAASSLMPEYTWGLSGTPIENEPDDLISILSLIDKNRISVDEARLPTSYLRSLAGQYTLRREREVAVEDLTSVTESIEHLALTPRQRDSYARELSADGSRTGSAWLAKFNRLRDICDFDAESGESCKIERATELISAVRGLKEKVVVFSWRLRPLKQLAQRLAKELTSERVMVLTGETPSTERTKVVEAFQSNSELGILLCSTKATAEGVTLTAASHVIFLNEWWNPAVNAQARDRVNRIGQKRDVYVHKLRTEDTVESRLEEILRTKSELFDEIVRGLTGNSTTMNQPVPEGLLWLLEGGKSVPTYLFNS